MSAHTIIENLNLGYYRHQITCSCGHSFIREGHSLNAEAFSDHITQGDSRK